MAQVLPAERDLRRVIGDGEAVPDGEVEGLTEADLLELYRSLVLLRTYDERSVVYHRQGRIGTYAIFWNHEAMQAGSVFALARSDWIFPSYRESAIGLLRGMPARVVLQWWRGHPSGWWNPADYNVASICVPIATRHVPESGDGRVHAHDRAHGRGFDVLGATLGALSLAFVTYALIEADTGSGHWDKISQIWSGRGSSPAKPVCPSPAFSSSEAGAPANPVAVKVTGLPLNPLAVAVTVLLLVPTVGPKVQLVRLATPLALVLTTAGLPATVVPPPPPTSKVTETPLTGFPPASVTNTEGGAPTAVPAVAL